MRFWTQLSKGQSLACSEPWACYRLILFYEKSNNRFTYLDTLEVYAAPQMENTHFRFHQYGVPSTLCGGWHFFMRNFPKVGLIVVDWRLGHHVQPGLNPLDFFWGNVKINVYTENIQVVQHLKERIRGAIQRVTLDVPRTFRDELIFRLDHTGCGRRGLRCKGVPLPGNHCSRETAMFWSIL